MTIGIISLVSPVHDPEAINRAAGPLINGLKEWFTVEEIDAAAVGGVDLPVVLVKTGGTEHQFIQLAPTLKESGKPVTLLTYGSNNSLPAAMEILSWAQQKGFKNTLLLHGSPEVLHQKLEKRLADVKLMETLKQTKIGVMGQPSDWLIASDVDYAAVTSRWGISFEDIDLEEIMENVRAVSEADAGAVTAALPGDGYRKDVEQRDLLEAAKIYLGVKKTVVDRSLSALTLRCFDLLKRLNSTGCLALARLNDEGIPAGCEGDIPALFTMLINNLITGKAAFMANPSSLEGKRITLAHCTVPLSMVESFGYRTHFESGIGVGVAGEFKQEPVTLSKIGGVGLDRFYVDEGLLVDCPRSEQLCRTQVVVEPEGGLDYFLTAPLGNHHIVVPGRHAQRFKEITALFL